MSRSRPDWRRVDALLEEALERSPEEREAFLEEACAGDPSLRLEVEALLAMEGRSEGFLESKGIGLSRQLLEELAHGQQDGGLGPGDRVGRYRLVEVLGRGGMSVVYRARRDDGTFSQEVALKLLRGDGSQEELATRLRAERQILADLSHPGLGKVFDGGRAEDGRPYLVVELVDGVPLTDYAAREGLSIRDRLRLFQQVTSAVQYAHRNLVVHRDLKPSNILVTHDGRVKLLDFGIARVLEEPGGVADATEEGARWMTPRYAAPEQILGGSVTTATDVHALGVILYELLTGTVPFGGPDSTRYEVQKAVCETDPVPPSTLGSADSADVVGPRLGGALDGDLDAIVLQALRKRPEDRYASAAALEEDIHRYLDGFPVTARPPALAYRARKFARRHWLAVGAAAVLAAVLLTGSLVLAVQQAETASERDRANTAAAAAAREAADAEAVIDFLADVFKGADPNQAAGDTLTALGLVQWAERRVPSELGDRPRVRAELLGVLGTAYRNLGYPDRGRSLLEQSAELTRAVHGADTHELAEALLRLANHHAVNRDFDLAVEAGWGALEALGVSSDGSGLPADSAWSGRSPEADARTSRNAALLARALAVTGSALRDLQQPDSAAVLLERAVTLERAAGLEDTATHLRTLMALAYVRRSQGQLAEAEAAYRGGIRRYRARNPEPTTELAQYLNNLGYTLRLQERYEEAVSVYREALEIHTDTYNRAHPLTLITAGNLTSALNLAGRVGAADSVAAASVEAARRHWGGDHWRVAAELSALGKMRMRNSDLQGAGAVLEEATAMYTRVLGPDHYWTLFEQANLEALRLLQGRAAEGRPALDALWRQLDTWSAQGGGVLRLDIRNKLEPFLRTLDSTGLTDEASRFRALMEAHGAPPL